MRSTDSKGTNEFDRENLSIFGKDSFFDPSCTFCLPISPHANDANDSGVPLCLSRPPEATAELEAFGDLASAVAGKLLQLQYGKLSHAAVKSEGEDGASVMFDNDTETFDITSLQLSTDNEGRHFVLRAFSDQGAKEHTITGDVLRWTDPETGEKTEADDVSLALGPGDGMVRHHRAPRLFPARVERKGNYGYSVEWADGASIIYSLSSIAVAAGGNVQKKEF